MKLGPRDLKKDRKSTDDIAWFGGQYTEDTGIVMALVETDTDVD